MSLGAGCSLTVTVALLGQGGRALGGPGRGLGEPVPAAGLVDDAVLAGGMLGEQVEVVVGQLRFRGGLVGGLPGQRVRLVLGPPCISSGGRGK